jgi:hypothetical protein
VSGLRPLKVGTEGMVGETGNPKLDELERLLNDPEVPMHAARVWELLAEISGENHPSNYRNSSLT